MTMSSKLREALSEIIDLINEWRNDGVMEHFQYSQLFDIADNALAEPLRNCDVGTTDDQIDRMLAFCGRKGKCSKCEHHKIGTLFRQCTLRWAQMPYNEGCAK